MRLSEGVSLLTLMGGGRGGIELLWSASGKQLSDNLLILFFGLMGGGEEELSAMILRKKH